MAVDIQQIKQRFGIVGNSSLLHRAIDVARQVASTDLSVLITGESGTGKEVFPKIIHQFGARKHGQYFALNCGAIPEGTIDSELFGHEKGSFTGALENRKGYFEVADKGTLFLDEVAELPLSTQVRLLRVLETGEFIKVGSSAIQKTNVRVIAATNVNLPLAIEQNKFREDLYYRLNSVPILIPPLRERKEDIFLLFSRFTNDFAEKYRMPPIQLTEDARKVLENYRWPGNIRQLKNIAEQISSIEQERLIPVNVIKSYLPESTTTQLPVLSSLFHSDTETSTLSDRELMYKILFDMRKDVTELKKMMLQLQLEQKGNTKTMPNINLLENFEKKDNTAEINSTKTDVLDCDNYTLLHDNLSLSQTEKDVIRRALENHNGNRKTAAQELGISERTLYRKIKEYQLGF